jgi:protein-disulfide isomerase
MINKKLGKFILPGSILVASVIISGSVLVSTALLLKGLNKSSFNLAALGNQNPNAANPSGGSGQAAENVTVSDRQGAPTIGKSSAKVTLYEFSDFQCPFCEKFYSETFGQIKSKYIDTGKVKLVYRHYPLLSHASAQKAAEAAECASRQGKFAEYQDLLFKNGKSDGAGLAVADLKKYADQLGLNKGLLNLGANKFNTCLDNGETVGVINQDKADAGKIGISGTPSFVIGGKLIVGAQPFSNFQSALDEALKGK